MESLCRVASGQAQPQEMVRRAGDIKHGGNFRNFLHFQNRQEKLDGGKKRFPKCLVVNKINYRYRFKCGILVECVRIIKEIQILVALCATKLFTEDLVK